MEKEKSTKKEKTQKLTSLLKLVPEARALLRVQWQKKTKGKTDKRRSRSKRRRRRKIE